MRISIMSRLPKACICQTIIFTGRSALLWEWQPTSISETGGLHWRHRNCRPLIYQWLTRHTNTAMNHRKASPKHFPAFMAPRRSRRSGRVQTFVCSILLWSRLYWKEAALWITEWNTGKGSSSWRWPGLFQMKSSMTTMTTASLISGRNAAKRTWSGLWPCFAGRVGGMCMGCAVPWKRTRRIFTTESAS